MLVFAATGLRIPLLCNRMQSLILEKRNSMAVRHAAVSLWVSEGKIMNLLEPPCSYKARPDQMKE